MKNIFSSLLLIFYVIISTKGLAQTNNHMSILSLENYHKIINFILKNGDSQTYCNAYNNNPHYHFLAFDVYLQPKKFQAISDCSNLGSLFSYDEIAMTLRFPYGSENQYFDIIPDKKNKILEFNNRDKKELTTDRKKATQYFKLMVEEINKFS